MYLIAQNPFRGEGERLPIHLNLRGWDTSGPNSRWHPARLWKPTTRDWASLPSSNRNKQDESLETMTVPHSSWSLLRWFTTRTQVTLVNDAAAHQHDWPSSQRVLRSKCQPGVRFRIGIEKSGNIWGLFAWKRVGRFLSPFLRVAGFGFPQSLFIYLELSAQSMQRKAIVVLFVLFKNPASFLA